MNLWGAKTIVLEHEVTEKADIATHKHHRFEEAFDALQWILARNTDLGLSSIQQGEEWRVYVQDGDSVAKTPTIWVLFTVSENEVNIVNIEVIEYVENTS